MLALNIKPDMSLADIIHETSKKGVLFFHNHNHVGSIQILMRSMSDMRAMKVDHLYLEIPVHLNADLKQHFEKKISTLEKPFSCFIDKEQRRLLIELVEKAHSVGIRVLAVDNNQILNSKDRVGKAQATEDLIRQRVANDDKMAGLIRSHIETLPKDHKYIGLFGGNHVRTGKVLDAFSVYLHSHVLPSGVTHQHQLPQNVTVADERTRESLKQIDIFTIVRPNLEIDQEELDLSKPCKSLSITYFNQLLKLLNISIECVACSYENDDKVHAVALVPKTDHEKMWVGVQKCMDPFSKRVESHSDTHYKWIFENIDADDVRKLIIGSIVKLRQNPK